MILPFLLAVLAFGALLPIVAPLLRGSRPVAPRGSFDQAVYRDQLQELDRDIARGLITPADADAARLEIQRRLLATDKVPAPPPRLSRSPVLALIVFVVIAGGSVGSYLWLGAPGLPDEPFSARKAEVAHGGNPASLQQATAALAAKLKQNPSDAAGWLLYGRSLAMLNQWDQAEDAYRHAIDLGQTDPDVLADHAEVLVMQAGGTVTPAAEAAFRQVLKADPSSGIARYYLALAAMQAGEPRQAIEGFQALLAEMPADSPLRAQLGQKVAEAAHAAGIPVPELAKGAPPAPAPGPNAGCAGRRREHVGRTAAGDDPRHGRQIGGEAGCRSAEPRRLVAPGTRLRRAAPAGQGRRRLRQGGELRPDDVSIPLQEVRALLSDQAPTDKLPPRVIGLLKHIEATAPDEPLVLWYLGMAAAQDARIDEARGYWSKLLAKMPPGGEDAKMVQSALDALSKR